MAEPDVARFDLIVIGAGVDGLTAATYAARAGRRVLLVDAAERAGGTAVTEEIAAGVRSPIVWSSVETLSPAVIDELDLVAHGLEIGPPRGVFVATGDARARRFAPPGTSDIDTRRLQAFADAGLEASDVDAFERFDAFTRRLADALAPVLEQPLPRLEASSMADLMPLVRPALRLRRLGRESLAEVMRFLPMPLQDVVDERFADEALRIAIAAGGLVSSWLGPRSPGGALNLMLHRCGLERGALAYPRFAVGGPGAVAEALVAAATQAGVEIRLGTRVGRFTVTRDRHGVGIDGVEIDGEPVPARAIVAAEDPRSALLDRLGARYLEPALVRQLNALRSRGTVGVVIFTLDALPRFSGVPPGDEDRVLAGRIHVASSLDDIERAFDDTKYGRLPRRPYLDVTLPTLADPSLAPSGTHVLHAWVQYPPSVLRDGDWHEAREALGDIVQSTLAEVAPGFTEGIRGRAILTPADLADRFALPGGSIYHLEPALDQSLFMRPLPAYYRHRSPVRRLYLAGPATHGGYGISGLSGRNASRVVLESD